jgi:hypothetical protein
MSQKPTRLYSGTFLRFSVSILMLFSLGCTTSAAPKNWRTECVGYHTIQLPGDIDYAVQRPPFNRKWEPNFPAGLPAWGVSFRVKTDTSPNFSEETELIKLTSETNLVALKEFQDQVNGELRKTKDELQRNAAQTDRRGLKEIYKQEADNLNLVQTFNNGTVFGGVVNKKDFLDTANGTVEKINSFFEFKALVGNRIVSTGRKISGTPQQTLDAFLKNYRARVPFELPTTAGVCLPYAFITGETEPASIGVAMRLKDQPEIVIYLNDSKTDTSPARHDPKSFINHEVGNTFYATKYVEPLDGNFKKNHNIKIDDRVGVGIYALITRVKLAGELAVHNEDNKDQDWGYLAYIPGDKKATSGSSSDLIFRVERFGRFAKQGMTEKEFRDLVEILAGSIKRRPGAYPSR